MAGIGFRALGAGALALALSACGGNTQHQTFTTQDGGKVDVTTEKDGDHVVMTGKGDDGSELRVEVNGAWPKELKDAGLEYAGSKVLSVMGGSGAGMEGRKMAVFSTPDSAEKVIEFYKARAAAGAMAQESALDVGGSRVFSAQNKQAKTRLTIHVQPESNETKAIVTYETGVD